MRSADDRAGTTAAAAAQVQRAEQVRRSSAAVTELALDQDRAWAYLQGYLDGGTMQVWADPASVATRLALAASAGAVSGDRLDALTGRVVEDHQLLAERPWWVVVLWRWPGLPRFAWHRRSTLAPLWDVMTAAVPELAGNSVPSRPESATCWNATAPRGQTCAAWPRSSLPHRPRRRLPLAVPGGTERGEGPGVRPAPYAMDQKGSSSPA